MNNTSNIDVVWEGEYKGTPARICYFTNLNGYKHIDVQILLMDKWLSINIAYSNEASEILYNIISTKRKSTQTALDRLLRPQPEQILFNQESSRL